MSKSAKKTSKRTTSSRRSRKGGGVNPVVMRSAFAILLYVGAILVLLSFILKTDLFLSIRQTLFLYFGLGMFFLPLILMSFGIFAQGFKFKLGQPHILVGVPLSVLSLLALISPFSYDYSGVVGNRIWGSLNEFLPMSITSVILIIILVIGLAVLFDTSLDLFFEKIFSAIGSFFNLIFSRFIPSKPAIEMSRSTVSNLSASASLKPTTGGLREGLKIFGKKEKKNEEHEKEDADAVDTSRKHTDEALGNNPLVNPSLSGQVWNYPPLSIFSNAQGKSADRGDVKNNSNIIEKTLESFGIIAKVVEIDQGPAVTRYALDLAQGTKIAKITSLQSDLAMALAAHTGEVRIEAPIPGKALVGIEIPNRTLEIVPIRAILGNEEVKMHKSKLLVPLGFDAACRPLIADIARMPHLLVAGTTNSGKSVMLNGIIVSILFRASPDEVKLILVDPKRVEMAQYNNIPHLLTPVINDADKIVSALKWAVAEMQRRYQVFSEVGARNIAGYNEMSGFQAVPYIVIIIDELADLMMFAPSEVEEAICRLAQMARAVGIHLIIATQRPSVDVLTGLIKANIPARMAFNVSSQVDSRVILDTGGAEKLLGRGDMLYLASDAAKPTRIQSPFVRDEEINALVNFIKASGVAPVYTEEVVTQPVNSTRGGNGNMSGGEDEHDPQYDEAMRIVIDSGNASASFLQRKMKVGYARAARLLDQLEAAGVVGPANGSKPREIMRREV
ncbi:MAG: DNA translocase FtsK [bacterium]|nr:DNA translocase FtsK [bacterium]